MSIQAGANTRIVATLRDFGSVSVEFLANVLDREPDELARYLRDLESKGVVEFRGERSDWPRLPERVLPQNEFGRPSDISILRRDIFIAPRVRNLQISANIFSGPEELGPFICGFVYGLLALAAAFGLSALSAAGAVKLEGLGMSSPWMRAIAIGLSLKPFSTSDCLAAGAEAFPIGVETFVQLFEPPLTRRILLDHFNAL